MPFKYWDGAFRVAVYLYNRLPSLVLSQKCPYEVLYHKTPNYSLLRTFGCACFPNIRHYNSHKLAFHSTQCTFLGYSMNHKGYKCLDKSSRIYIPRDVIFYENTFPFTAQPTVHSSPMPLQSSFSINVPTLPSFSKRTVETNARNNLIHPTVFSDSFNVDRAGPTDT